MTRQNNPKIQTGSGPSYSKLRSCSKKPKIPEATECTKKRKTKAFPYDVRYNIYESLTPVAIADATPVDHLEMGVRIGTDGMPFKGGKRRKTRKNKSKKTFRKIRSKNQRGGAEYEDNELLMASSEGNIDRVKELLEKGADVNAKDNNDSTALIKASESGHPEVVAMLLKNGADVNAKTTGRTTALIKAILYKHPEIVQMLLENGADVNAKTMYGSTMLSLASWDGNPKIVKLLKEYIQQHEDSINFERLRIKAPNPEEREMPESAKKFLSLKNSQGPVNNIREYLRSKKQKGSGVNCSSHRPCTTDNIEEEDPNTIEEEDPNTIWEEEQYTKDQNLKGAIRDSNAIGVSLYLDRGANPNITMIDNHEHPYLEGPERVPAVIYAARHIFPSTAILKYLLQFGASVQRDVYTNSTPLIEAAKWGNLDAVRFLLSKDYIDINATKTNGVTAIEYAVVNHDIPMINLMLEKRKGKINFNYTVIVNENNEESKYNENVIDIAKKSAINSVGDVQKAAKEIVEILKKYVNDIKHEKLRVARLVTEKGTPSLKRAHKDVATRIAEYLGGKRKTRKNHKKK